MLMEVFFCLESAPCSSSVEAVQKMRLITAIKTPYLPDGRFDLEAFDELVSMQIENGVEGLIVGGTTGEGQLMTWDEHIMLIAHTVNFFGDKIKVIGTSCSSALFLIIVQKTPLTLKFIHR